MATITWSVEDFRKGQRWSGQADTVVKAQAAAQAAVDKLERPGLQAIKATVTRRPRTGPPEFWNARPHVSGGRASRRVDWERADA